MSNISEQIRDQFKQGDNLTRLIMINIAVYVLMLLVEMISFLASGSSAGFTAFVSQWFALSSNPFTFIMRPYTLITYMFIHAGFFHLLFNMLILYFSGRIFMEYVGDRRLLALFVYGGIAGGMLFFVLYNISPAFTAGVPLVGASAGVVAVLVAAAVYAPNLPVRLFFVLEVKFWIVAALAVVSYVAGVSGSNSGGNLAHLGGAALGYWFVVSLKKGTDWSIGFYKILGSISTFFSSKKKSPLKKVYPKPNKSQSYTTQRQTQNDRQRVDEILDKIKEHGYDKLSKEEKDFLFKFGKK